MAPLYVAPAFRLRYCLQTIVGAELLVHMMEMVSQGACRYAEVATHCLRAFAATESL
jgi:hypothetical protein